MNYRIDASINRINAIRIEDLIKGFACKGIQGTVRAGSLESHSQSNRSISA